MMSNWPLVWRKITVFHSITSALFLDWCWLATAYCHRIPLQLSCEACRVQEWSYTVCYTTLSLVSNALSNLQGRAACISWHLSQRSFSWGESFLSPHAPISSQSRPMVQPVDIEIQHVNLREFVQQHQDQLVLNSLIWIGSSFQGKHRYLNMDGSL